MNPVEVTGMFYFSSFQLQRYKFSSVLTLYMASKRKSEDGKMIQAFSKINLIDLAGSEDNRRTGNAHGSAVFKESTKINLSLTVLKVSSNQI